MTDSAAELILNEGAKGLDAEGPVWPRWINGQRRTPVSWLVAVALITGSGCSPRSGISEVQLGTKTATRDGNVVTVYGWKEESQGGESDRRPPGLELESCRTRRNGLLLDAGNFAVRTAQGALVNPSGSNFTAERDCVRGEIVFDVVAGDEALYALYRAGRKVLRWSLSTNGG